MAQQTQQQTHTVAVFDEAGEPIPREQWPDVARRYAADRVQDAAAERQRDLEAILLTSRQQHMP